MVIQGTLWEDQDQSAASLKKMPVQQVPVLDKEAASREQNHLLPDQLFDLSELFQLLSTVPHCSLPTWDDLLAVFSRQASPDTLQLLPCLVVRVRALTQQYKPTGSLLFTPLCDFSFRAGQCGLCGNALESTGRYRCFPCALALRLILGYQSIEEWLQNGSLTS